VVALEHRGCIGRELADTQGALPRNGLNAEPPWVRDTGAVLARNWLRPSCHPCPGRAPGLHP
jgi:hypothetical protein